MPAAHEARMVLWCLLYRSLSSINSSCVVRWWTNFRRSNKNRQLPVRGTRKTLRVEKGGQSPGFEHQLKQRLAGKLQYLAKKTQLCCQSPTNDQIDVWTIECKICDSNTRTDNNDDNNASARPYCNIIIEAEDWQWAMYKMVDHSMNGCRWSIIMRPTNGQHGQP